MAASPHPGVRLVFRCRYLTARCPVGCESWLHPRAVAGHVGLGRCRGEPWVDSVEDSALVPKASASLFAWRLPAALVGRVNVSEDRVLRLRSAEGVWDDVLQGIVIRSPVEGVNARRWMYVIRAAVELRGPDVVEEGMTPRGFSELERELQVDDWLIDCPDCGEPVKRSRINLHRTKSTLCRWRRARDEVRRLWQAAWRDPSRSPEHPSRGAAFKRRRPGGAGSLRWSSHAGWRCCLRQLRRGSVADTTQPTQRRASSRERDFGAVGGQHELARHGHWVCCPCRVATPIADFRAGRLAAD